MKKTRNLFCSMRAAAALFCAAIFVPASAQGDPEEIGYTTLFQSHYSHPASTLENFEGGLATTYRIPGLACTVDGKNLVAVCDERITGWQDIGLRTGVKEYFGGFTKINVVYKMSSDGGKTWSERKVLMGAEPKEEGGVTRYYCYGDPIIGCSKTTGEFVVVYVNTRTCSDASQSWRGAILASVSTDNGATWSTTDISHVIYGASTDNTDKRIGGFATSGGMAAMADGRVGFVLCKNNNGTAERVVVVGTPQGNGKFVWNANDTPVLTSTFGGVFPDESKFVELPDKTWLMSCRTFGARLFARSNTAHNSWTKQEVYVEHGSPFTDQTIGDNLIDSGCNGDLLLLSRGNGEAPWLIQSVVNKYYDDDRYRREHVSMYISKDNGATWSFWKEPISCQSVNSSFLSAYSSMCQLSKNVVGILTEEDWDGRPAGNTNHSGEYNIVFSSHCLR
ncbi:MAG: exo-alpha-sialidase [Muribaculaceae bacterium]|nr:exo-alpha-sialidase [Muribaculaceae bacterium]